MTLAVALVGGTAAMLPSDRAEGIQALRVDLGDHRSIWAESGPENYRLTFRYLSMAADDPCTVTVRGGVIVRQSDPCRPRPMTIEHLFDYAGASLVGLARSRDPANIILEYDPALGYPSKYTVDLIGWVGGFGGVQVEAFEALP